MESRWTLRRVGGRVKRHLLRVGSRMTGTARQPKPVHETTVSVIVPIYNVEAYLEECLTSVREQQHRNLEIIIVNDGSPDGSVAIAERHAAEDPRIRIIHQENKGLGAARNTGIRHATGDFFFFVDSDDAVPSDSVARMVGTAARSGSDIVAGAALRFNSTRRWRPDWVDLHGEERLRTKVEDLPEITRNNYTWGKLYRASFWRECDLWFREGVSYEDQPIITQLFVHANGIDIIPTITYKWRQRDDLSSISQQMHTLSDLTDRVAAWDVSNETLLREASPPVYEAWLRTLYATHFHWYLKSDSTYDDDYWNLLQQTIARVTAAVPPDRMRDIEPQHRVALELARRNLRDVFHDFKAGGGYTLHNFPTALKPAGLEFRLPTFDDPDVDISEDAYLVADPMVPLVHRLDRATWVGGQALQVSGWAYFRYVDLTHHSTTISVTLRHQRTGEEVTVTAEPNEERSLPAPMLDKWADYDAGSFVAELPVGELLAASPSEHGDVWTLSVRVQTGRLDRTVDVTRVHPGGSGRFLPPLPHERGFVHRSDVAQSSPFRLQYLKRSVPVVDLTLSGDELAGTLDSPEVTQVSLVNVNGADTHEFPVDPATGHFSISLADLHIAAPADRLARWSMRAQLGARSVPLTVDGDLVTGMHSGSGSAIFSVRQSHRGAVLLHRSLSTVELEQATITGDVLVVGGHVPDVAAGTLTLSLRAVKTRSTPVEVDVHDGGFTARVPLVHSVWRFGDQPLPSTAYTPSYELRLPDGTVTEGDVEVSDALTLGLPCTYESSRLALTMSRAAGRAMQLQLTPPVGPEARGAYQRNRLEQAHRARSGSERLEGLLIETNFGEIAGDNGVSVHRELQRRGADLPVYWTVKDHSVVVPEGGIPVVRNSLDWYERLRTAKYFVNNMYQPGYHNKPPGQVVVETFHGYPFKVMGHSHWENLRVSRHRIETYDKRAREWDYLVSPARYATPLLKREFRYDGEVLEIGYPRNDVLVSLDAPAMRALTRKSLGVADGVTVVLYAPTFRDYLSRDDHRARMGDFLDAELLTRALGDDYVLLIRGHAFHARTSERSATSERIVDVTDYPDPADLYLASDLAILDYSSLRFDYALTGKPMLFLVPDLDLYENTRGWLLDYPPTAPGPLLKTTDQVAVAVEGLDAVVAEHADAYQVFRETYLDLEDGQAAARLVDAVFVPRDDAPPRR